MDHWSRLEDGTISFLHCLLRSEFEVAHTIFANSTGINQMRELITGLGRDQFSTAEQKKWNKINESLVTLVRTRNHIIHGQWWPTVFIHSEDKNGEYPIAKYIEWRRLYSPSDPSLRRELRGPIKAKGKDTFVFSLDAIHKKTSDVTHCRNRLHKLHMALFDRISPQEQPRESSPPPIYTIQLALWNPAGTTKASMRPPRPSQA